MTQPRSSLPQLVREAEAGILVRIARRDGTAAYLLSRDHLEAIVETMDLPANPKARRAIEEHRAGRTRFLPLTALDAE